MTKSKAANRVEKKLAARKAELEELKRKEELAAREKDKSKGNDINFNDPFSSSKKKSNSSSSSLKEGYSHYKRKRFSKAESFFGKQGSKGKKLAADVRTVDSNWSSGSKAVKAKQWSRAVSTLEKARRADSNLGKHHRDAISSELAEAYGGKGLDQLKKKDYINARKSLTSKASGAPAISNWNVATSPEATSRSSLAGMSYASQLAVPNAATVFGSSAIARIITCPGLQARCPTFSTRSHALTCSPGTSAPGKAYSSTFAAKSGGVSPSSLGAPSSTSPSQSLSSPSQRSSLAGVFSTQARQP